MGVDGLAAARTLLDFGRCDPGYCLRYVWQAYKRNGASTNRSAPTAYVGWQNSDDKHPGDRNPPPGVPVWWGPKASSSAGDVVISLGGGRVVATDWPYNGVINITTIDQRERQIGRPYLGWTGDILGAAIDYPGGDDVGTIDSTKENKQVIKDALFEFMRDVGPTINGEPWRFMGSVLNQRVQAQDVEGRNLYFKSATDRTVTTERTEFPVLFTAAGYLASINAQVSAMRKDGVPITLDDAIIAELADKISAAVEVGATKADVEQVVKTELAALVLKPSA